VNYTSRNFKSYNCRLSACSGNLCGVSKQPTWCSDSGGRAEWYGKEQHRYQSDVGMELP